MLVTRPHTAAGTRAASGSSLLGRIRFSYPPEDNNGYSQMV